MQKIVQKFWNRSTYKRKSRHFLDRRSSFSLLDFSGNFFRHTALIGQLYRSCLCVFDWPFSIHNWVDTIHRVLLDPDSDVSYSEECQTKKLSLVCCEMFAILKAISLRLLISLIAKISTSGILSPELK